MQHFYSDVANKENECMKEDDSGYERMKLKNERFNICTESIHHSVQFIQSLQMAMMKAMVVSKKYIIALL